MITLFLKYSQHFVLRYVYIVIATQEKQLEKLFLYALIICLFTNCKQPESSTKGSTIYYPSKEYEYVTIDSLKLLPKQMVYVPIYSHIYILTGKRISQITATLSIRSTNFSDSLYVSKVDYYSSQGKLIKRYLSKLLLLKPMHSVEFVVEENEAEGGAGANFIVEYSSLKPFNPPLIQAVMISMTNSSGLSFTTDGVPLPYKP